MSNDKSDSHEERKCIQHSKIYGYWKDKSITEDGKVVKTENYAPEDVIDVVVDYGEPECWACGTKIDGIYKLKTYDDMLKNNVEKIWDTAAVRKHLQRCHIVPHALGGADDDPSNYFLLCDKCHAESPDTMEPSYFLRWVYKKRKQRWIDGRNLYEMANEVIDECKRLGKDPHSFDISKVAKAIAQGNHMSDATMIYSFVSGCSDL